MAFGGAWRPGDGKRRSLPVWSAIHAVAGTSRDGYHHGATHSRGGSGSREEGVCTGRRALERDLVLLTGCGQERPTQKPGPPQEDDTRGGDGGGVEGDGLRMRAGENEADPLARVESHLRGIEVGMIPPGEDPHDVDPALAGPRPAKLAASTDDGEEEAGGEDRIQPRPSDHCLAATGSPDRLRA